MRLPIWILVALLFSGPANCQDCGSASSVALETVTASARRILKDGLITGWDIKAFNRAGDLASVAILRALPTHDHTSPTQTHLVLYMIRESFSCLDLCVQSRDDKEPRVTLLLLGHISEGQDRRTRSDIEQVRSLVLKEVREQEKAASGTIKQE